MRRFLILFAAAAALTCAMACDPDKNKVRPDDGQEQGQGQGQEQETSDEKLSGITYQLNVYSFADSDGDGWGDINGSTSSAPRPCGSLPSRPQAPTTATTCWTTIP